MPACWRSIWPAPCLRPSPVPWLSPTVPSPTSRSSRPCARRTRVSAYVRGALLNVGRKAGVASGQAVVTGEGLAGRIAEVGDNSARVLYVTDVNSRLPVLIERTRERAILAGDNSAQLRLTLLQSVAGVQRGDRIITSGHGGSFPVGIPVGAGVETGEGSVRVRPFGDFSRLALGPVG